MIAAGRSASQLQAPSPSPNPTHTIVHINTQVEHTSKAQTSIQQQQQDGVTTIHDSSIVVSSSSSLCAAPVSEAPPPPLSFHQTPPSPAHAASPSSCDSRSHRSSPSLAGSLDVTSLANPTHPNTTNFLLLSPPTNTRTMRQHINQALDSNIKSHSPSRERGSQSLPVHLLQTPMFPPRVLKQPVAQPPLGQQQQVAVNQSPSLHSWQQANKQTPSNNSHQHSDEAPSSATNTLTCIRFNYLFLALSVLIVVVCCLVIWWIVFDSANASVANVSKDLRHRANVMLRDSIMSNLSDISMAAIMLQRETRSLLPCFASASTIVQAQGFLTPMANTLALFPQVDVLTQSNAQGLFIGGSNIQPCINSYTIADPALFNQSHRNASIDAYFFHFNSTQYYMNQTNSSSSAYDEYHDEVLYSDSDYVPDFYMSQSGSEQLSALGSVLGFFSNVNTHTLPGLMRARATAGKLSWIAPFPLTTFAINQMAIAVCIGHRAANNQLDPRTGLPLIEHSSSAIIFASSWNQLMFDTKIGSNGITVLAFSNGLVLASNLPEFDAATLTLQQPNFFTSHHDLLQQMKSYLLANQFISANTTGLLDSYAPPHAEASFSYNGYDYDAIISALPMSGFNAFHVVMTTNSDFDNELRQTKTKAIWIGCVLVVSSCIICMLIAQCISRPITRLVTFMQYFTIQLQRSHDNIEEQVVQLNEFIKIWRAEARDGRELLHITNKQWSCHKSLTNAEDAAKAENAPIQKEAVCTRFKRAICSVLHFLDSCLPLIPLRENQLLHRAFGSMLDGMSYSHAELESVMESKRRFIRYIFHEVRVPFNAIVLGVEQLKEDLAADRDPHSPRVLELIKILDEQSKVVSRILNDVLSLHKIEDGSLKLTCEPFSMSDLVLYTVRAYERLFAAKEIKVEISIQDFRACLEADLMEWVRNKYTPRQKRSKVWKRSRKDLSELMMDPVYDSPGTATTHTDINPSAQLNVPHAHDSSPTHTPSRSHPHCQSSPGTSPQLTPVNGPFTPKRRPFNVNPRSTNTHMITSVSTEEVQELELTQHEIAAHIQQEYERLLPLVSNYLLVDGDKYRLRQVLANFLSNSLKFTDAHGTVNISMTCRLLPNTEHVNANATQSKPQCNVWSPPSHVMLKVSVKDSGIGISEQQQSTLFKPYFQVSSHHVISKGTGLGLNIAKSLIDLHGGQIGVVSNVGEGSEFYFEVPLSIVDSCEDHITDMLSISPLNAKCVNQASSSSDPFIPTNPILQPPKALSVVADNQQHSVNILPSPTSFIHVARQLPIPEQYDESNKQPVIQAWQPPRPVRVSQVVSKQHFEAPAFVDPRNYVSNTLALSSSSTSPSLDHSSAASVESMPSSMNLQPRTLFASTPPDAAARPPTLLTAGGSVSLPQPTELSPQHATPQTFTRTASSDEAYSTNCLSAAITPVISNSSFSSPLMPPQPTFSSRSSTDVHFFSHNRALTSPIISNVQSTDYHPAVSPRVLIAEDSLPNRKLLILLLKTLGCQCVGVEDGLQAVREFEPSADESWVNDKLNGGRGQFILSEDEQAARSRYDLIMMDGNMPVMNGMDATRNLRAMGFTLPIIAVTGNALDDDVAAFFQAGCNHLIKKPYNREHIESALVQYCSGYQLPMKSSTRRILAAQTNKIQPVHE